MPLVHAPLIHPALAHPPLAGERALPIWRGAVHMTQDARIAGPKVLTPAARRGTVGSDSGDTEMIHFLRVAAMLVAGFVSIGLDNSPARAANFFEKNFWMSGPLYSARLPVCDDAAALSRIQQRFDSRERRFWHSDMRLVAFNGIHEVAFRPWTEGAIPRRFCAGKVQASDGVWRPLRFVIGEDLGFAGFTWGVDWCVVGLDRNWANNPLCKMKRP